MCLLRMRRGRYEKLISVLKPDRERAAWPILVDRSRPAVVTFGEPARITQELAEATRAVSAAVLAVDVTARSQGSSH